MVYPKRKNLIIAGALLLSALICLLIAARLPRSQQSQFQAERWAGESGESFAQYTAFLSPTDSMDTLKVMELRYQLREKLIAASVEVPEGSYGFCDCWSANASTKIRSGRGSFDAAVVAVGGDWFAFHPMSLRSGVYLAETDLMHDRVVLDEQLAWLLFGSADVTGMTVSIEGTEFLVAGVVAVDRSRAADAVSQRTPTLYIPFDTWEAGHEGLSLSSYEIVLPEPVEGFAASLLKERFPLGSGALVRATGRFTFSASLKYLRDFAKRTVRTEAVAFSDWENAARWTESWCALLRFFALALLVFPAVLAVIVLARLLRFGKEKVKTLAARLKNRLLGIPEGEAETADITQKAG